SIWLAEQGYRVTLADLSPDLLAVAGEKTRAANVELEAVVEANACDLSQFEDASFDVALCFGPLYHLFDDDDRRIVACEVKRVVRSGGVVFAAFLIRISVVRFAVNQDIPFFTPYSFDLVKRWQGDGI